MDGGVGQACQRGGVLCGKSENGDANVGVVVVVGRTPKQCVAHADWYGLFVYCCRADAVVHAGVYQSGVARFTARHG